MCSGVQSSPWFCMDLGPGSSTRKRKFAAANREGIFRAWQKKTIQQILLCAKELFGRYGYDKVSMRDIADRVGISVGNLTYY